MGLEEYRHGLDAHKAHGGDHEIGKFDIVAAVNRAIDRGTLRTITDMRRGLGSLATIGAEKISNLSVIVIDNELYSETGMQPTHTSRGVDLAGVAQAAGFVTTANISTLAELKTWIPKIYNAPGPLFLNIKVNANRYPLSIRLRDGAHIKNRFREALLGSKAFD